MAGPAHARVGRAKSLVTKMARPSSIVLGLVFALWCYVGRAIVVTGSCTGYLHDGRHVLLSIAFLVVAWALLSLLCGLLLVGLDALADLPRDECSGASPRHFLGPLAVLLACWLPYVVISLPGAINFDYFNQLSQFFGDRPLTNHHPVLTTMVFGWLYELGYALGGARVALVLTVVVQVICLAASLAYAQLWFRRMGVSRAVRIVALAFEALCPIYPLFARVLVKDTLSAATVVLFATLLGARLWQEGRGEEPAKSTSAVSLALCGILCSLTRANCVYLVAAGLVVALPYARRPSRRGLALSLAAVVVAYGAWTSLLLPALGVRPTDKALALTVPLQQTAAYQRYAPEDVTDSERKAIQGILKVDYDQVGSLYDPATVDPVQSQTDADDPARLSAYLSAWRAQGLRHPGIYLDAFLRGNVGYWCPLMPYDSIQDLDYSQNTVEYHYQWMRGIGYAFSGQLSGLANVHTGFESARAILGGLTRAFAGIPVLGLLDQPAFYSWACLLLGVWLLTRKGRALPVFVMAGMVFLVECASPLHASMRYALPMATLLPVLLCLSHGCGTRTKAAGERGVASR